MNGTAWQRLAALYLLIQGLGVAAWWLAMLMWPEGLRLFVPESLGRLGWVFIYPDLLLLVPSSLLAGFGLGAQKRWAPAALSLAAGCGAYASVTTFGMCAYTGQAWLGTALMAPVAAVPMLIAWRFARD